MTEVIVLTIGNSVARLFYLCHQQKEGKLRCENGFL
jgi:hypothetical protein